MKTLGVGRGADHLSPTLDTEGAAGSGKIRVENNRRIRRVPPRQ
jgi:hypothetical protein